MAQRMNLDINIGVDGNINKNTIKDFRGGSEGKNKDA